MSAEIKSVLAKLERVKPSGDGWSARCPAHKDKSPSLSVSEGDDGRVLLKCHAGCSIEEICTAIGISQRDLFARSGTQLQRTPAQSRKKDARDFPSPEAASKAVLEGLNRDGDEWTWSRSWSYTDSMGGEVMQVMRLDHVAGLKKTFRPLHRCDAHWRLGDPKGLLPLYRLTELARSDVVFVLEGEKAADAAVSLGLVATTSAHGSGAAKKTDWGPISQKRVVILPDADRAGRKYAADVAALLRRANPHASVRIVELPGLATGQDLVDYIEVMAARGAGQAEIRAELDKHVLVALELPAQAKAQRPIKPATTPRAKPYRPYVTFPAEALPSPIKELVIEGAAALGCPLAYVALPALSVLASAVGTTRMISPKPGWKEYGILWTAIVGESGSMKSPAIDLALDPLKSLQVEALHKFRSAMQEFAFAAERYDEEVRRWKKAGMHTERPEPPLKPSSPRLLVSDITIESLAVVLQESPRGVLLMRDELAGWIQSFDAYKRSGGGDSSQWIEMYGGRSIFVDRKSNVEGPIVVPAAAVSITGGIQPAILNKVLGREHRDSGLAARLLMASPPRKTIHWSEAVVNSRTTQAYAEVVRNLRELDFEEMDQGRGVPKVLPFTHEAQKMWVTFYNEHAEGMTQRSGDEAAAWSKLQAIPARLALIFHNVRHAMRDATLESFDAVDAASLEPAIYVARWFRYEIERLYSVLAEDEPQAEQRKLMEVVAGIGGRATVRQVQQAKTCFRDSADRVRGLLDALALGGQLQRVHKEGGKQGGHPVVEYVLASDAEPRGNRTSTAEPDEGLSYCYDPIEAATPGKGEQVIGDEVASDACDSPSELEPREDGRVRPVTVAEPFYWYQPTGFVTGFESASIPRLFDQGRFGGCVQ